MRPGPPPDEEQAADQAGWRPRLVIGWAGMRGAITLALLLAVPLTTKAGLPLRGRDDIIYLGFAVIIVTLVAQGMTLPLLVRRLRLTEHPAVAEADRQGRLALAQAVLNRLQGADRDGVAPEVIDGLRAQYLARRQRLESGDESEVVQEAAEAAEAAGAERALRRDLIDAQRETLARLRHQRRIGVTTARTLEHDLDLEEARLG
jgi:CPA1 family monovalent cation:H+ antiporter